MPHASGVIGQTAEGERRFAPLTFFRSLQSWRTGEVFPLLFVRSLPDERYVPIRNCTLTATQAGFSVTGDPAIRAMGDRVTIMHPDDIVVMERYDEY